MALSKVLLTTIFCHLSLFFYSSLCSFLYKQLLKVFNPVDGDELNIQVAFDLWVNITTLKKIINFIGGDNG